MEVLVATLPEGEDPDSLVRAQGADALRRYLDDALDIMDRKIQLLDRKGLFTSIKGTRRAIDVLLPTVRAAREAVVRGLYLKRISDRTSVPVETLEAEVERRSPSSRAPLARCTSQRRRERERGAAPRFQADLSRYEPRRRRAALQPADAAAHGRRARPADDDVPLRALG